MNIDLVRIWASPSTLHLRLLWGPSNGKWCRSTELHIGWETIPRDARRTIMLALEQDHEPERHQPTLFSLDG